MENRNATAAAACAKRMTTFNTILGGKSVSKARRVLAFVGIGSVSLLPMLHFFCSFGLRPLVASGSFRFYILGTVTNICGGILYALKIPECFIPGKCDILFHSHQFLHICVTAGAYFYLSGFVHMSKSRLIHT